MDEAFNKIDGEWYVGGEILNLRGWEIIKGGETDQEVIILAMPTAEPSSPCNCGAPASTFQRWGFTGLSFVRDLPIRHKRVRVYFRQQRYRCSSCRKTLQPPLSGIDEQHSITTRLREYVERESLNIFRTFTGIADEVGLGEMTVRNIFTAGVERREKNRDISAPEWLAIDEVYLGKSVHCVITDPLAKRVLDLLPDNKQETLAKWLLQLPDRHGVKVITMDMWEAYKAAVRLVKLQAEIVVDRFHVHNLLNSALKDVLQVVRDSLRPAEQRKYMRDPRLLLKSRFRLSDDDGSSGQKQAVNKWLEDLPDIGRAYQLKEALSDILQLKDRQKAEEALDLWLEQVSDFVRDFGSKYRKKLKAGEPFSNVITTVQKWKQDILNYVEYKRYFKETAREKVTNAFAEQSNKQIKLAYRLGSGYAYEVIRAKVVHGGLLVKRRPPHPLDERRLRIAGGRGARKCKKKPVGVNAGANVARLEKAREDNDETLGLIPSPEENLAWADRFDSLLQLGLGFEPDRQETRGNGVRRRRKEGPRQPSPTKRNTRRALKYDRDQLKMF